MMTEIRIKTKNKIELEALKQVIEICTAKMKHVKLFNSLVETYAENDEFVIYYEENPMARQNWMVFIYKYVNKDECEIKIREIR